MTTRLLATPGLALAGLLTLTLCGQAQPHKAKPHKPSKSAHAPNPGTLKQLAAFYSMDGYTVRPPQGYQLEQRPIEASAVIFQIYEWKGPKRADQSYPEFTVIVVSPQPGYEVINSEKVLAYFQKVIQKDVTDFVQSPVADVGIHDLDFSRAYWKGTDRDTSHHLHGFTYTSVDSRTGIMVSAQDAEPYNQATLALAEAAVKTFSRE